MQHSFRTVTSIALFAALAACATTSTKVSSSWRSPDIKAPIGKVLVVGLAREIAGRMIFENEFVKDLGRQGVTAIPSFTVFPSTGMPDRSVIQEAVKQQNINSVLVTRIVKLQDFQKYVPGMTTTGPYGYYDYYTFGYNYMYSPGYTISGTQVVLETSVYDAATDKLRWAAGSDTTTEGDRQDVINSFIKAIIEKMKKDGLLANPAQ